MKTLILVVILSTTGTLAFAKGKKAKAKAPHTTSGTATGLGAKLDTNFQFDELTVRGRYQGAAEGIATVEDEKQLADLIDYRVDFKDRLNKSVGQK